MILIEANSTPLPFYLADIDFGTGKQRVLALPSPMKLG